MTFEQSLEAVIKRSLDALPVWCKGEVETHEWSVAYGDRNSDDVVYSRRIKLGVQMLPYYMCKHCHAVSHPFTTNPYPKRAR